MPNARVQSTGASGRAGNITPAARPSDSQLAHGRAFSPFVNSRISESNTDTITNVTSTTGGRVIGLLLSLTYSTVTSTTTVVKGGYGPHARIT